MFITRQTVNLPSEIILSGLVVKFVDRFKRHLFSYKLFMFYPDFKDSIWTENDKRFRGWIKIKQSFHVWGAVVWQRWSFSRARVLVTVVRQTNFQTELSNEKDCRWKNLGYTIRSETVKTEQNSFASLNAFKS